MLVSVDLADSVFRVGSWRVDPSLDEISKDGSTVKLERRAMQLLLYLARHPGQVISVEQLLDEVWKGVVVTPDSVYHAVAALRRVLGDDSADPVYITNVPRRGYRLVAAVTPWAELQASPSQPAEGSPAAAAGPSIAPLVGQRVGSPYRWVGWVLYALVVVALGYLIVERMLPSQSAARGASTPAPASAISDKSIAVLPFADLSEKRDQEYLADGLAEELISLLASLPELKVIGRTSSFQFQGRNADVRSIGALLGVAYVVEGSVRRYGDRVRITAQLMSTQDGAHRWSDTDERNLGDVLRLQQDITAALGRELQLEVGGLAGRPAAALASPEAYNSYLQGRHSLDRYDQTGFEEAVSHFENALALDPHLIRARESLAGVHFLQCAFAFVPAATGASRARHDVDSILQEDPRSAMGHALRARLLTTYDWNWPAAQREAELAVSLARNSGAALYAAADLANVLGRWEEAETLFRRALAIDPLNPDVRFELAVTLSRAGRSADAETEMRRALQIRPLYAGGHFYLGLLILAGGDAQAGLSELQQERYEGLQAVGLAMAFHALQRKEDSDTAMRRADHDFAQDLPALIGWAHAYRGEADAAFQWFDRAYLQKDYQIQYIRADPLLRKVQSDPRYRAFLHKMNLPE